MTTDIPDDGAKNDDESMLFEWLRERDVECPLCRYNLRGLTAPRCPECGNGLRLSVALLDPYAKAWVTLATIACGSAGMGLFFLCIILRAGMPPENLQDFSLLFFVLTIPAPIILLKTRRRFQRLERKIQWRIAVAAALPSTIAMIVLCSTIR